MTVEVARRAPGAELLHLPGRLAGAASEFAVAEFASAGKLGKTRNTRDSGAVEGPPITVRREAVFTAIAAAAIGHVPILFGTVFA